MDIFTNRSRNLVPILATVFLTIYLLIGIFFAIGMRGERFVPLLTGMCVWWFQIFLVAGDGAMSEPLRTSRRILPAISLAVITSGNFVALMLGVEEFLSLRIPHLNDRANGLGLVFIGGAVLILVGMFTLGLTFKPGMKRFAFLLRVYAVAVGSAVLTGIALIPLFVITSQGSTFLAGLGPFIGLNWCVLVMIWAVMPGIFLAVSYRREKVRVEAVADTGEEGF